MYRIPTLIFALALATSAFAQEDASVNLLPSIEAAPDAGWIGPSTQPLPSKSLDAPEAFVHIIFSSVKDGNWWAAASAFLVLIVSLIRSYGKKLHDWLPDESVWDKPFWFIFDTKPGGWILNIATAIAGGVGTALVGGEAVNWSLVKPILMVSITGAAMWEMGKDLFEWFKAKGAAAPAVVPAPPPAAPPAA
jgi:hypothetical protein